MGCVLSELNSESTHCAPAKGSVDWPQTSVDDIRGVRIENTAECGGLPILSPLGLALSGPWGPSWADQSPISKAHPTLCPPCPAPPCLSPGSPWAQVRPMKLWWRSFGEAGSYRVPWEIPENYGPD